MTKKSNISDPERIAAVGSSGLLDSPPEAEFDRLARLAAQLLHAPAAFVTVIDKDRQYLKSAMVEGVRTEQAGSSTELDRSFCQHAVASEAPFIVEDAREHELVKNNKAVADGVIAYAGIPLHTHNGQPIGALCVVDSKPRHWTGEDIENLRALARGATQLIEERTSVLAEQSRASVQGEIKSLVDCVAHHLRAADSYSQLVGGPAPIDLGSEGAAQAELIESMRQLRASFEEHATAAATTQAELVSAVARYLDADRAREEAARAFGQGTVDLGTLEFAIQQHMDAADLLRITAIDRGADL